VSSKGSFDAVTSWLSKARGRRGAGAPPLAGVLVANKIDLRGDDGAPALMNQSGFLAVGLDLSEGRAVVTQTMGMALAKKEGLEYFETSAMAQRGNLDPFHFIADQFHRRYAQTAEALSGL